VFGVVPRLVDVRILEAEVSGEVEYRQAGVQKRGRQGQGRGVRHRKEHDVRRARERSDVGLDEGETAAGQRRIEILDSPTGVGRGGDSSDLELGMAQQQAHELDPRVSRSTDDRDPDHDAPCVRSDPPM
jgi:hypothetical protein